MCATNQRYWIPLCLVSLVLGCQTCTPRREQAKPNILLLVLDACRPDRMGCYGYELPTTPTIDELSRDPDSVLFRRHYVQGAWTKAATASLFTGLFAFQYGVMRGHAGKPGPEEGFFTTQILDEGFDTMAERLRRLGFFTFAVPKSRHLVPEYGFAQGFDEYFSVDRFEGGDLERVNKTLELAAASDGAFFGYVHLAGCHHPFMEKERDPEWMRRFGFDYDEPARIAAGVDFTDGETKHAIVGGRLTLEDEDVRFLSLVYDAQMRTVDGDYVAPLLEGLRKLGRYDNTLILVTADHGEELYEHRGYAHGHALWDEVIRVPLVVKFPKGMKPAELAQNVDKVTQSVDLLPAFLAFAGEAVPAELPGTDIFGGEPRGFAYSQKKGGWAMVEGGYKIIEDGSEIRLFHLERDPTESNDLAGVERDRVEQMLTLSHALREHVAVRPQEAPVIETELDPEAIEALRGLGYLE